MIFVFHSKILHKHCLQFLSGAKMAPRETENNAYAKFGVTNKEQYGMLWYFLEWSIRATKTFSLFCSIAAKRVKTQSWASYNMFDSNLSQQIKFFGKLLECWHLIGHNYVGITLCTGGTSLAIENVCLGPVNARYVQIVM